MTLKLDGTGSITGIDQGLNVVGVVTYSTDLNVGGDLNVTGVLTYDDVTNVDSIGVVTARSGVHFGTAASGTLVIGNSTGIGIGTDNPTGTLEIVDSYTNRTWTPTSQTELLVERNGNCMISAIGSTTGNCVLNFGDSDDENGGAIDYDHADDSMQFRTGGVSNRLRITSDGKIGIGNTLPLHVMHFKNEMSATPSYIHMEVTGTNTVGGGGGISFDTSASNNSLNNSLYLATIRGERTSADNGSNNLVFSTSLAGAAGDDGNTHSPAERLRIGSSGQIGLSGANYGTNNQVITSTGTGSAVEWRGVNAAFYGKQDSTHNISHATWSTVKNFATEAINTTGWSESTGVFTANASTAGTYYVFGSCGIDDVQTLDVMRVGISKNNETPSCFTEYRQYSGAANQITGGTMVGRIVTLANGDNVRMKVYQNEGNAQPTEANRTFFGGFRLSV